MVWEGGYSGVLSPWRGGGGQHTRTLQGGFELSLPGLALLPARPQRSLLLHRSLQPLPQPQRLLLALRQLLCGTKGTAGGHPRTPNPSQFCRVLPKGLGDPPGELLERGDGGGDLRPTPLLPGDGAHLAEPLCRGPVQPAHAAGPAPRSPAPSRWPPAWPGERGHCGVGTGVGSVLPVSSSAAGGLTLLTTAPCPRAVPHAPGGLRFSPLCFSKG